MIAIIIILFKVIYFDLYIYIYIYICNLLHIYRKNNYIIICTATALLRSITAGGFLLAVSDSSHQFECDCLDVIV